jgi:hypothetical protein
MRVVLWIVGAILIFNMWWDSRADERDKLAYSKRAAK